MSLESRLLGIVGGVLGKVVAGYSAIKSTLGPKKVKVKAVKAAPSQGAVAGYKSSQASTSPQAVRLGRRIAQDPENVFIKCKNILFQELKGHPITREIQAGPTGSSSFLSSGGDLFSFIGFRAGSDPISDLINFLESSITLGGFRGIETGNGLVIFEFNVSIPSESEFATKEELCMIWEKGNPWPFAVEKGIAGYSNYLHFGKDIDQSVSKRGLQAKNEIRDGEFSPTGYISDILNNFKRNLNSFGLKATFEK